MKPSLFYNFAVAEISDGASPYLHAFGGGGVPAGATMAETGGYRIHILYTLNLVDPAIPFASKFEASWLPLLYCFDFRVSSFGYKVASDRSVTAFLGREPGYVTDAEEYPFEPFPDSFREKQIMIESVPYNPNAKGDALQYAGIFGLGTLNKVDRAAIIKSQRRKMESLYGERLEEDEILDSLCSPFIQSRPNGMCADSSCVNHSRKGRLTPIAVIPSVLPDSTSLFGPHVGIQIIYEVCEVCGTIRASNQSG